VIRVVLPYHLPILPGLRSEVMLPVDGPFTRASVLDDPTTPGDFVRNVKLVCDLARQISRVAPDPATTAGAAAVAKAMFRGVVSASVLDAAG